MQGERYYAIRNVQKMPPFFISIISDVDHWLFVSSTGGLSAGRGSPETPLFPYVSVDKIYDSITHTGCKTILHLHANGERLDWEPFNIEHNGRYRIQRQLYKNVLGDKLCFEEINLDLELTFRYSWASSDQFGFVRRCELENIGHRSIRVDMIDGLQNILPAGTPSFTQTNSSNLVDAYKWTELLADTGLALYTLFSGISDRPEPNESLRANTAFCLGLDEKTVLISSEQLEAYRAGAEIHGKLHTRGIRGAYLVNSTFLLKANDQRRWQIVANIEQSQHDVIQLQRDLREPNLVAQAIHESVQLGTNGLARIMASADAFQLIAEENISVHHYANVLFNVLRGGIFYDQYNVSKHDFVTTLSTFNRDVLHRNRELLGKLPDILEYQTLLGTVRKSGDQQLMRICHEYLPITFGRRHGDPSRPWNKFAIRLTDEDGHRSLSYEGNWRDLFQNWEALALSYPEFVENMIAKFVNASTIDGYNPYRVTKDGFDWEVEEPDDPWSYIGYWGDHQIIYLQKLLEISSSFHPDRLSKLLRLELFCYANVPYRIRPFEALLDNAKETVDYDQTLAELIEKRVQKMGADGKLILEEDGEVYQVNLLEKLLVPLLAKLGNLVIDGGIWLNTQRPEWNDANNALVGQGLSMVTLYYLRRYVVFLRQLLESERDSIDVSKEVNVWLKETAVALAGAKPYLSKGRLDATQRFEFFAELGRSASRYRDAVYRKKASRGKTSLPIKAVSSLLENALAAVDHSIHNNRRTDGLYHAYNTLGIHDDDIEVGNLYPMLEGQVAALSSGAIAPSECINVLDALFDSDIYRDDQKSFMLYPDRPLSKFLEKNRVPEAQVESIPLLSAMLEKGDTRILIRDAEGAYRFNADITNARKLKNRLQAISDEYGNQVCIAQQNVIKLYESVFNHQAFTGRSGGMFGFEGLGCVYWHMVAKLLLAVQENFFEALDAKMDRETCQRLGDLYYRIRAGLGFNKSPAEYGAFPTDPYSHTPTHSGAQQPGMTGVVKEEIISRFGELGARVNQGSAFFLPALLRRREFLRESRAFRFLDVDKNWQEMPVPKNGIAFTWCQVPILYRIDETESTGLSVTYADGKQQALPGFTLSSTDSVELFRRTGRIRQVRLTIDANDLFSE